MKLINSKPVTMGEARDIITKREADEKRELSYEQKLASEHLKKFTRLGGEKAVECLKELNSVLRMSPEVAIQIVNVMPDGPDELRMIFSREKFSLKDEEVAKILEIIKKYE